MSSAPLGFTSIWIVLCGVKRQVGEPVTPIYLAALDLHTVTEVQCGAPKLRTLNRPPYPTCPQTLLVTINAEELLGLHLALNWRMPERIIDLVVEFKNIVNGTKVSGGMGFAGALMWFGLPTAASLLRGSAPPLARRRLSTVAQLFDRMKPRLKFGLALLRGRNLQAVARIEATGIPIDAKTLSALSDKWSDYAPKLLQLVDQDFGFYDDGQFNVAAFEEWLCKRNIDWPRLPSGAIDLSDDAFSEGARVNLTLRPLKELRVTLKNFRPSGFVFGGDGRNRSPLRPFSSRTGRNQPSNASCILYGPAWMRNLIRPEAGMGLALIDWDQQEFGIAAALSGDVAMQQAYRSGDPYLALALAAGAPNYDDAGTPTKAEIRGQFKVCTLGVQYGMGAGRIARLLRLSEQHAAKLVAHHRATYPDFWRWSDQIEASAFFYGELQSVFGWRVSVGANANPRFVRNFPMQANGAEMLRLACCSVTEADVRVCAPLHDALLIEAPSKDLPDAVATTQRLMAEASAIVLDGFALRTSTKLVSHPNRLGDSRGIAIWNAVESLLGKNLPTSCVNNPPIRPARERDKTSSNTNTCPIS